MVRSPYAILLALLLLMLVACEPAKPPEPPAPPGRPEPPRSQPAVQIEQAAFGVFERAGEASAFRPTKTVPLKPDTEFGWVIGLTTTKPTVRWREEFTVPAAPETWGPIEGRHELSADRRVSTLEREVSPAGGFIFNSWVMSPGDPKGRHVMKVTVEDEAPIVFEFDVE